MFTKKLLFACRYAAVVVFSLLSWLGIVSVVATRGIKFESDFWQLILLVASVQTILALWFLGPTFAGWIVGIAAAFAAGLATKHHLAGSPFVLGTTITVLLGQVYVFLYCPRLTLSRLITLVVMSSVALLVSLQTRNQLAELISSLLLGLATAYVAQYCKEHGQTILAHVKAIRNPILVFIILYLLVGIGFAVGYNCIGLHDPSCFSSTQSREVTVSFESFVIFSFAQLMNANIPSLSISYPWIKMLALAEVFAGLLVFAIYLQLLVSKLTK